MVGNQVEFGELRLVMEADVYDWDGELLAGNDIYEKAG